MTKGFLQRVKEKDYDGSAYDAIAITDTGWGWIERNRSRFSLRSEEAQEFIGTEITDDDIPF